MAGLHALLRVWRCPHKEQIVSRHGGNSGCVSTNGSLHMTIQTGMLIETGQFADEGPCTGCPVGRFSEAGNSGCLEMLSAFLAGPPEPALNATGGSFGVAHLAVEVGSLAAELFEGVRLAYAVDVVPEVHALRLNSTCSTLWGIDGRLADHVPHPAIQECSLEEELRSMHAAVPKIVRGALEPPVCAMLCTATSCTSVVGT